MADTTGSYFGGGQGLVPDWDPFIGTSKKWEQTKDSYNDYMSNTAEDEESKESSGIEEKSLLSAAASNVNKTAPKLSKEEEPSEFDLNNPQDVQKLQEKLNVTQDGWFGPETEMAYRDYMDMQESIADENLNNELDMQSQYMLQAPSPEERSEGLSQLGGLIESGWSNLDENQKLYEPYKEKSNFGKPETLKDYQDIFKGVSY